MTCPNCKSNKFIETVSLEYCPDCGIRCDYHGSGTNEAYNEFIERLGAEQKWKDHCDHIKWLMEMENT